MEDVVDAPFRKPKRLAEYDYSKCGVYFITFCTKNRREILGEIIVGRDDLGAPSSDNTMLPILKLTEYGKRVQQHIESIEDFYKNVTVDTYVIMPNHIHLLIEIIEDNGAPRSSRPTNALIPTMIAALKKMVNRDIGYSIWQESYYDHIIRDETDYLIKWNYIDTNPARWAEDEYFTNN